MALLWLGMFCALTAHDRNRAVGVHRSRCPFAARQEPWNPSVGSTRDIYTWPLHDSRESPGWLLHEKKVPKEPSEAIGTESTVATLPVTFPPPADSPARAHGLALQGRRKGYHMAVKCSALHKAMLTLSSLACFAAAVNWDTRFCFLGGFF